VSIFTKFLAEDPDSGRREYYPSRGYELDITQLVAAHGLRVADPKIATLKGNILQGLMPGRTEVQVQCKLFESGFNPGLLQKDLRRMYGQEISLN